MRQIELLLLLKMINGVGELGDFSLALLAINALIANVLSHSVEKALVAIDLGAELFLFQSLCVCQDFDLGLLQRFATKRL